MTPNLTIEQHDLVVLSAEAFYILMNAAQSTTPISEEQKSSVEDNTNIAIPQATFTELDFVRWIESDELDDNIAELWEALSPEDQAAQLRDWLNQDYDWACEKTNDALVNEIERTFKHEI